MENTMEDAGMARLRRAWWLSGGLWVVIALVAYRQSIGLWFAQDDWYFLERIVKAEGIGGWIELIGRNDHFYRPVARVIALGGMYALDGLNSSVFHGANIIIHGLNAWMLTRLTVEFTRNGWAAFAAGWLYVLHSAVYMAVTWVAGIQELMLTSGVLVALLAYTAYWQRGGWWRYGLALLGGAWALFSKDMAVALPLWIAVLGLALGDWAEWRRIGRDSLGFGLLVGAYWAVRSVKAGVDMQSGPYQVALDPWVWIANLEGFAAFLLEARLKAPAVSQYAIILLLLGLAAALLLMREHRRWVGVGLIWFATALGPVIVLGGHQEAYYLMLPLVGFSLAIGAIIGALAGAAPWRELRRWRLGLLLLLAITSGAYFEHTRWLRWDLDEGGLRRKGRLGEIGVELLAANEASIRTASQLTIGNIDPLTAAAWGNGAMVRALYPHLSSVELIAEPIIEDPAAGRLNLPPGTLEQVLPQPETPPGE